MKAFEFVSDELMMQNFLSWFLVFVHSDLSLNLIDESCEIGSEAVAE